jgi:hypothetical protein
MSALKQVIAERARCLWILDTILSDLKRQVNNKLLVESAIHLTNVKIKICEALVTKAKRLIISNAQPKHNEERNGDPAQ